MRDVTVVEAIAGGMIAGRYEILRELGRGGIGVVYLAKHIQMDRLCALKVLQSNSLVNPEAVARFHREARNASRVSHPNVVAIYDFGETPEGTAYLAMEFVEGRSLDSVLDEVGPLPPRRAARIIWQIANGLTVAHDLQIVHRDLKPANIMLTRFRDWEDFVKVVDFGIAKAFGTAGSTVTGTGLAIGTPGYMSPEQWTGPDLDHRSDIYSLAMIAVRMLAGAPPANKFALPIAGAQILEKIPAAANWPADLKAVLARALEPFPENRYDTVAEFAHALVMAITHWVPATPGVREPWDERLTPSTSPGLAKKPASVPGSEGPAPVRRRGALVAVFGGVAVLGVAGWLLLAKSSAPVSPGPAGPSDSVGVRPESSVTRLAEPGQRQPVRGSSPRSANPPAVPTAPQPAVLPPAVARAVWADSAVLLVAILDLDHPVADSARLVVARATRLLRQALPDSVRVDVGYRLAEAQFFLGEDAAGCATLRQIDPVAGRTGYFIRSIRDLLSRACK